MQAESFRGRRIVARLEEGTELSASLLGLARGAGVRSALVRVVGTLDDVTLSAPTGPRRVLGGPADIVSFEGLLAERGGTLALDATVAVARESDAGLEVLGGRLERARIASAIAVLETFDDLVLRRDDSGGLVGLVPLAAESRPATEAPRPAAVAPTAPAGAAPSPPPAAQPPSASPVPRPAAPVVSAAPAPVPRPPSASPEAASETLPPRFEAVAPQPPAGPSWSDVVRASSQKSAAEKPPEEDDASLRIQTGDIIQHPVLGRCVVERIEGDHEFATVRRDSGRIVRLSLEVLRFRQTGAEGSRRLFRVTT